MCAAKMSVHQTVSSVIICQHKCAVQIKKNIHTTNTAKQDVHFCSRNFLRQLLASLNRWIVIWSSPGRLQLRHFITAERPPILPLDQCSKRVSGHAITSFVELFNSDRSLWRLLTHGLWSILYFGGAASGRPLIVSIYFRIVMFIYTSYKMSYWTLFAHIFLIRNSLLLLDDITKICCMSGGGVDGRGEDAAAFVASTS